MPYFRGDQKPHYRNQDIWFKYSASLLYVYPLGHLQLVYTTYYDDDDDRAFYCQGINNDRN